jgi:ribokinase
MTWCNVPIMRDVLGIGALNVDMVYQLDDPAALDMKLVPGGEIVGRGERFHIMMQELDRSGRLMGQSGGGSAANAAYAMSRLGLDAAFLGTVGNDDLGDFLLKEMGEVDLSHVRREGRSGLCISVQVHQDRSLITLPNANDLLRIGTADIDFANSFQIVHISSFAGAEPLRQLVKLAEGLLEEVMLSFDPGAKYASRGLDELLPIITRTDILLVNEMEIEKITGMGAEEGCRRIMEIGPDVVVLKKGHAGAVIFTEDERIPIAPVPTQVVDRTGAGDVFAGAFLTGIVKGWGLRRAGEFGAMSASRSIAHVGRTGYPDQEMMKRFGRGKR